MKRLITICLVVGLMFAVSGAAQAAQYTFEVSAREVFDGVDDWISWIGTTGQYDSGPGLHNPPAWTRVAGSTYHSIRHFAEAGPDTSNAGLAMFILYPWKAAAGISPELGSSYDFSPSLGQATWADPAVSASLSGVAGWTAETYSHRRYHPDTDVSDTSYNIPNVFASRPGFTANGPSNWMPYFTSYRSGSGHDGTYSGNLIERDISDAALDAIKFSWSVDLDPSEFVGGKVRFFYGALVHDPDRGTTSWEGEAMGYVDVVPEPATIALLGLGALSLLRRRKNS